MDVQVIIAMIGCLSIAGAATMMSQFPAKSIENSPNENGKDIHSAKTLLGKSYTDCMTECLQKPTATAPGFYKSCQTDTKCWMKLQEKRVSKCIPSCVFKTTGLSPFLRALQGNDAKENRRTTKNPTTKNPSTTLQPSTTFGPFGHSLQCLEDCMGKTVKEILAMDQACQDDIECAISKAGPRAGQCVDFCFKPKPPAANLSRRSFVTCMALCLDLPIGRVIVDFHHCGYVAQCWVSEVGDRARGCLDRCRRERQMAGFTRNEFDKLTSSANSHQEEIAIASKDNGLVSCATCLGMSIFQIMHLRETCGSDILCWIEHIGEDMLHCLPQCLDLERNIDMDRFWKALAPVERRDSRMSCLACLGMSVIKHDEVSNRCGYDVECWMPHIGEDLHCLPSCLLLQERDEENKMAAYKQCVRDRIGKNELLPRLWYERCSSDAFCWQNIIYQVLTACSWSSSK